MLFARVILALSAAPFFVIGFAFLLQPDAMASHVGLRLDGAIADNDVRAVYGGLQLGLGGFLAICASRPAWVVPGLVAQLLGYGGLAAARLVSLVVAGSAGTLGALLHVGEGVGLLAALLALGALRAASQERPR